jgi:hypothetical protein
VKVAETFKNIRSAEHRRNEKAEKGNRKRNRRKDKKGKPQTFLMRKFFIFQTPVSVGQTDARFKTFWLVYISGPL